MSSGEPWRLQRSATQQLAFHAFVEGVSEQRDALLDAHAADHHEDVKAHRASAGTTFLNVDVHNGKVPLATILGQSSQPSFHQLAFQAPPSITIGQDEFAFGNDGGLERILC